MLHAARLDALDLLRGVAAFLVLAGHLRSYIFQSFVQLEQSGVQAGIFVKIFYFATGLGHQAVMIFFALSGFLVGGKALEEILKQKFLWSRYLLRRLTRLWIVIIPTLLLTLALDKFGHVISSGVGYDGRYYDLYLQGPVGSGTDHSMLTFFGNLAFLQTIYVPSFGTNGPMWSLANEFWYYMLIPLIVWSLFARVSLAGKLFGATVSIALLSTLPIWLLEGGVIWVGGAAAFWFCRIQSLAWLLQSTSLRVGAVVLLISVLVVSKSSISTIGDLGLGLAVALCLPFLAHVPSSGPIYSSVARGLSEISYTLYLTHFPFLTFVVFGGIAPMRWAPSVQAAGIYVLLLLAAVAWAIIVWWCFERNTGRVYSLLASKFTRAEAAKHGPPDAPHA